MITNILNFIKTRILVFVPTILGIAEAVVKFVKEVITLIVDILYPIIPSDVFKTIVSNIRAVVDKIYDFISANKQKILDYLKLIP